MPTVILTAVLSLTGTASAEAKITIWVARIMDHDVWITGQVDEPNTRITLDDTYTEETDSKGRFEFRVAYHPSGCIVEIKTGRQSRSVVIGNCGQRGPRGQSGYVGERGEPGARGPPGPPGPSGASAGTDPPTTDADPKWPLRLRRGTTQ